MSTQAPRYTGAPMPEVHPSAIIEGDVRLADDVVVGPWCSVTGDVELGPGTTLVGHVWIHGPVRMGEANVVYPGACLGFSPQSVAHDHDHPGHGLVIGDRNRFREGFTAHRAMTDDGPTRLGSDGYYMAHSHVGHDSIVGDRVVLANSAAIGGHCQVGDRVFIGGGAGVHQFVRMGEGVMMAGNTGVTLDVPPWFTITDINYAPAVNLVGLRRSGMARSAIETAKWAHRTLAASGLARGTMIERLRARAGSDDELAARYLEFVESGTRGLVGARPRARSAPGTARAAMKPETGGGSGRS